MFRTAELGRVVSKEQYHDVLPTLRTELLEMQQRLRAAPFPVIIVFAGVDGAGKAQTVNQLNEWLDPRWLINRAFGSPSDEEAERPEYWRYWRELPPKGRIGLFLKTWYSPSLLDRVHQRMSEAEFDEALDRVIAFENGLADDGALIIKFWMHLGKKAQKQRLQALEKDPLTRWQITQTAWDHWHLYDRFIVAAERTITRTSTANATWHIVEGYDKRYRTLTVGTTILQAIGQHFADTETRLKILAEKRKHTDRAVASGPAPGAAPPTDKPLPEALVIQMPRVTILSRLDMNRALGKKEYKDALVKLQGRLRLSSRRAKELGLATILVLEGWDAAGKGGAIRRITAALEATDYQVISIAAPSDEEKAQHYLWRFWRHLSRAGRFTIYDRSWYGRVLVERAERFAAESEWRRAYSEINDFEDQLVRHGIVLCKFWMHITKDEQLARFKVREGTSYKRWKLTEEDWRNRDKWDDYEVAVNDMVERTSTAIAPWTLVEGNDKRFARIKALSTVCDRLQAGIDGREASAAKAVQGRKLKETG
ncbi:MAG: polyphosphate:AMP phosphotransferase [Rhodospirillales bacterium]